MIHESVFDPFERILALYLLSNEGAKQYKISFEGYGNASGDIGDDVDINLHFSTKKRREALAAKQITGQITLLTGDNEEIVKKFRVENRLVTFENLDRDPVNGTYFGHDLCYPEAKFTRTKYNKSLKGDVAKISTRPFYGYCFAFTDTTGVDVFYGPKALEETFYQEFGQILSGGRSYSVGIEISEAEYNELLPAAENDEVTEVSEDAVNFSVAVILEEGDVRVPYLFGQSMITTKNFTCTPFENEMIQKITADAEIACANGGYRRDNPFLDIDKRVLTIPMKDGRVSPEVYSYYMNNIQGDERIQEIFEGFSFSEGGIMITYDEKTGFVVSRNSKACFAFSLAYFIVGSYGAGLISFYSCIRALLECGAIFINENGILEGRTASGKSFDVTYNLPAGSRRVTFRRLANRKDMDNLNGISIIGLDLEGNKYKGEADHYVVASFHDGDGTIIFDAFNTNSVVGAPVSNFVNNEDFAVITFDIASEKMDPGVSYA